MSTVDEQFVHLCLPRAIVGSFRNVGHKVCIDRTECFDIILPIVHSDQGTRQIAKHVLQLFFSHRFVSSQGGHHVGQTLSEHFVQQTSELASAAVAASMVGRQRQYSVWRTIGIDCRIQCFSKVFFA